MEPQIVQMGGIGIAARVAAIHHDGYLIAAKLANGTKADIDNVCAEVRN
jgi:hypothetical protein